MKRNPLPLLALLVVPGLAACQHPMGEPIGPFGDAVQHNAAMQIIDPEPLLEAPPAEYDGARAALMMERYKTDEIDEPVDLRTVTFGASTEGD